MLRASRSCHIRILWCGWRLAENRHVSINSRNDTYTLDRLGKNFSEFFDLLRFGDRWVPDEIVQLNFQDYANYSKKKLLPVDHGIHRTAQFGSRQCKLKFPSLFSKIKEKIIPSPWRDQHTATIADSTSNIVCTMLSKSQKFHKPTTSMSPTIKILC